MVVVVVMFCIAVWSVQNPGSIGHVAVFIRIRAVIRN